MRQEQGPRGRVADGTDRLARVHESFDAQRVMATLGARLADVAPGRVEIVLPFGDAFTQHNGFLHAGVVTTVLDSACGYAAFTLMPEDADVLTAEYKVNFLAPAVGERIIARGQVLRPGRSLTVCTGTAFAVVDGREKAVAQMQATMMAIRDNGV
ncbi:MAG TPA: PaaI family thioesterase [Gammaproteobacteria bacterium]|nr:PaaI family thioesterase [Gammaproteobacteria bacterium]